MLLPTAPRWMSRAEVANGTVSFSVRPSSPILANRVTLTQGTVNVVDGRQFTGVSDAGKRSAPRAARSSMSLAPGCRFPPARRAPGRWQGSLRHRGRLQQSGISSAAAAGGRRRREAGRGAVCRGAVAPAEGYRQDVLSSTRWCRTRCWCCACRRRLCQDPGAPGHQRRGASCSTGLTTRRARRSPGAAGCRRAAQAAYEAKLYSRSNGAPGVLTGRTQTLAEVRVESARTWATAPRWKPTWHRV